MDRRFVSAFRVATFALFASCVHQPGPPPGPPVGMPEVGQAVQVILRDNSLRAERIVTGFEGEFIVLDGGLHLRMSEIVWWNEQG